MKVRLAQDFWLYAAPDGAWELSQPWVRNLFGDSCPGMVAVPVTVLKQGEEIELTRRDAGAPDGAIARAREIAEAVIIEVLTRGVCATDDDHEAIAQTIAAGMSRSAAEPARRAAP